MNNLKDRYGGYHGPSNLTNQLNLLEFQYIKKAPLSLTINTRKF